MRLGKHFAEPKKNMQNKMSISKTDEIKKEKKTVPLIKSNKIKVMMNLKPIRQLAVGTDVLCKKKQ